MKIIDLLNEIANGEEVPKKVKFNNEIYTYKPEWKDYADEDEHYGLLVDTIPSTYQITKMLNEEIKIIEDKKIEKLFNCCMETDNQEIQFCIQNINAAANKINELIDELNKLKGDNDDR